MLSRVVIRLLGDKVPNILRSLSTSHVNEARGSRIQTSNITELQKEFIREEMENVEAIEDFINIQRGKHVGLASKRLMEQ